MCRDCSGRQRDEESCSHISWKPEDKRADKDILVFRSQQVFWSLHEFFLGIHEALCDVVDGLVLSDWVLLNPRFRRVEGSDLRLVTQAVLQLSVGTEETRAEGLDLSVLTAEPKLNSEPVAL